MNTVSLSTDACGISSIEQEDRRAHAVIKGIGNYTGTSQTVTSKGNYDGIIAEYNLDTNSVVNTKFIRGTLDEIVNKLKKENKLTK